MIAPKFISISPVKISQRVRKPKPLLPNYKDLLKLKKPKVVLEDPDSDLDDENQRHKVNEERAKITKKVVERKVQTPKISALEEQFSKSNTLKVKERPKTMSIERKSLDFNRCHRTSHKKQRTLIKSSQPSVPVLITNALREPSIKKQPHNIKSFLSSLRFSSMELKPNTGLELLSVDSHMLLRPRTSLMSIGSRDILAESANIKALLSFQELKGLVSKRLAINYKK